jgi:hypothetical protein
VKVADLILEIFDLKLLPAEKRILTPSLRLGLELGPKLRFGLELQRRRWFATGFHGR